MTTTEVWETKNNITHTRPSDDNNSNMRSIMVDDNVDMKWVQLPDEFGGHRVNVVDKKRLICSCKRHTTTAYFLENGFTFVYCLTEDGIIWFNKKTDGEKQMVNANDNPSKSVNDPVSSNGKKKRKKKLEKEKGV